MATNADQVRVILEADASGHVRDINVAAGSFDANMQRIERSATRMERTTRGALNLVKVAAGSMIASFGVQEITQLISRGLEYAASLGEQAQQLGVTTEALQVYRYAGTQVGLTNSEIDAGLAKLTRTAGEAAAGQRAQATAFNELRVSVRNANGDIKSTDQLMREVADGLSRIEDPAARARLEIDLFGRAGQKLDTLLSGGSGAIDELRDAAHRLGIVLSEEQIRNADVTADKLSAVKAVLEARIAGVVADNASAIVDLANALASVGAEAVSAAGRVAYFYSSLPRGYASTLPPALAAMMGLTAAVIGPDRPKEDPLLRALRTPMPNATKPAAFTPNPISTKPRSTRARGGGDPAAEDERRRKDALRLQYDIDMDEVEGRRDILRAQQELVVDYEDRNIIAKQLVDIELQARDRRAQFDADMAQADRSLSAQQKALAVSRAQEQQQLNGRLSLLEKQAINLQEDLEREQQFTQTEQALFAARRSELEAELALANTASERRAIELKILDLAYQEHSERLKRIIETRRADGEHLYSWDDRYRAQTELTGLNANRDSAKEAAIRGTMGPLESYLDGIPDTVAEINEALQNVAATGLRSLTDGLTDAATKFIKLGGVAGNIINQIIADLMRMAISQHITAPLGRLLGGLIPGIGAGKPTGLLAPGSSLSNTINSLPGRASGGHVSPGQMYRINEGGGHRVEGFVPAGSGKIIPLGQMSKPLSGGTTVIQPVHFDLRGALMTEDILAQMNVLANQAAQKGAMGGLALSARHNRRAASRRL